MKTNAYKKINVLQLTKTKPNQNKNPRIFLNMWNFLFLMRSSERKQQVPDNFEDKL